MIVKRDLLHQITPFLKRKEFISIVGPRQAGKSTFLGMLKEYLIKENGSREDFIEIITFEDRKLLLQFEADPIMFVNSYLLRAPKEKTFYLMIDEFQYAEEGGQKLKLIYDTIKNIKIIITGSSSLEIKAKVGKFMVGRILNFYLHPFNFKEFLAAKDKRLLSVYEQYSKEIKVVLLEGKSIKVKNRVDIFSEEFIKFYEEFCIWGGYPAVVLAKKEERQKLLTDIYNNYILKDIKTLLELATEKSLFLLSQYLAAQISNILVYQNLSQVSGLSYRDLIKHLNILKETFVCREIRPFSKFRQKELSKAPKIFFLDLGFRNNLVENTNGLAARSDAGAVIENSVFIRLNELSENFKVINFWRTKAGAEVDFVWQSRGQIFPLEVKYSLFTAKKISKSLASFIDIFKPKRAIILNKNYWGKFSRGKTEVIFIPVYYL